MAKFKVGDRVRILYGRWRGLEGSIYRIRFNYRVYDLPTGTLLPPSTAYQVDVDGIGRYNDDRGGPIGYLAEDLAPAVDPGADAFLERIRKLKPYEEPTVRREEYVTFSTKEGK